MNCTGFCNEKKAELIQIVSDVDRNSKDFTYDRLLNLLSEAFISGAESMTKAKESSTKSEAVRKLQALSQDIFLSMNRTLYLRYLFDMIDSHTDERGKLSLTFKDEASDEIYELFKTIYDLGLVNGVELSKDPSVLNLYFKHKDRLIHE